MGAPVELTPRRATLQSVALLTIFYAYIYGNAALRGSASLDATSIVASAFVTGGLMLLVTALLLRRDVSWVGALQAGPIPVPQALAFGAVGVLLAYAGGALAIGVYTALGPDLQTQLAAKAAWASRLSGLPLYWVLPLSAFVGFWEELVFRGFLLGRLKLVFGGKAWVAVLVSGVLFGLGHGYQGLPGLLQTSMVGVALGAVTVWRKSLWPAVIAHLSIDTFGLLAIRVLKPAMERLLAH